MFQVAKIVFVLAAARQESICTWRRSYPIAGLSGVFSRFGAWLPLAQKR